MMRVVLSILTVFLLLWTSYSCSTEKNTAVNRAYHGMTARYNGYFNANELLRLSMSTFRSSLKENYYEVLPIDALPNEEQVVGLYPAIDTAIVKCTKVIQRHSMPSNDKPSLKKEEHNNWIDENWTTIGIANFYRRDYDAALKGFSFVKKFYSNDPSIYVADLWMAKTNIQLNKLTEAGFNLKNLDKALAEEGERTKEKPSKKDKEEEPVAKVPKKIMFDFYKTKAEFAIRKQETKEAIKYLNDALEFAKVQTDISRTHFIIAQLNEATGDRNEAKKHYTQCLKYNAPYEMHFNARLKRAFMGGDEKVRKELMKMLRDAKNAPYKDQIYYALADIELQRTNESKAVEFLTLSAFYSTANVRQKGMSYEKLGNLSFGHRDYVKAQKYYDSCARVIDDTYPNAQGVRNKASNLADLVSAVETAAFEDSVQRIARMEESERIRFIENVIKKVKEEEERRKKMEAEKLRELQQNQNTFVQNSGTGSKWYFNNPKTRSDGFDEFRKLWGTRENEDNWRRSDKTVLMTSSDEKDEDSTATETKTTASKDSLTVDMLLSNIPLTDSLFLASQNRMMDALYSAGVIYKEQLNEPLLARKQFDAVRAFNKECPTDLSTAFQLYKLLDASSDPAAQSEKDHILTVYPNSDYANYLRDPDFFVKRKERDALAEKEYLMVLERYNKGLYMPVISRAEAVITQERENKFRPKFMLLKAMSMGQMTENKRELLPVLQQLATEYPGTEEEVRAKEMIKIINEGYSKNVAVDRSSKSPFKFDEKASQWVIIFLDKNENSGTAKSKVSDFNREFFSRDGLKVSSKIFGDDQSVILVQDFKNDVTASNYVRIFKATRKHLLDLQKAKIMVITQENMKLLFEKKELLQEYETFYDEFY